MTSAGVWLKWINHCAILLPKWQKCDSAASVPAWPVGWKWTFFSLADVWTLRLVMFPPRVHSLTSATNGFSHHGAIFLTPLCECAAKLCHEWNISTRHNLALGYFQKSFKVDGVINSALPQTPVSGHQKIKDWRWTSEISYQRRPPFK